MGLFDSLSDDCYQDALVLARRMAVNSGDALRCSVSALRAQQDVGLDQALQREADMQALCFAPLRFNVCVTA